MSPSFHSFYMVTNQVCPKETNCQDVRSPEWHKGKLVRKSTCTAPINW